MCVNKTCKENAFVIDFDKELSDKKIEEIKTVGDITIITSAAAFINMVKPVFMRPCAMNGCSIILISKRNAMINSNMSVIDYVSHINLNIQMFDFDFNNIDYNGIHKENKYNNQKLEYMSNSRKLFVEKVHHKNKLKEMDRADRIKREQELKRSRLITKTEENAIFNSIKNIHETRKNRPMRKKLFEQFKQRFAGLSFGQYKKILKRASV